MKRISYIYHDPDNTSVYWQGYTEDFDPAVISIADKIAEQVDLRTAGGSLKEEDYIKFIIIQDL